MDDLLLWIELTALALAGLLLLGVGTARWIINRGDGAREKMSEKLGKRIGEVQDKCAKLETANAVLQADKERVGKRLEELEAAGKKNACKDDLDRLEERLGKRIDGLSALITENRK